MENTIEEDSLFRFAMTEFIGQDDSMQTKLVYCYFGLAIYWAQCIEQTFQNMIILKQMSSGEILTQKLVDSFLEKVENSKATMGRQITNVKRIYSISNEHEDKLKIVLYKRNHLSHNFFKVNSMKFFTEDGKKEMIKECAEFVDQSKKLDRELKSYYQKYQKKIGITDEFIQKEIKLARQKENQRVKNNNEI